MKLFALIPDAPPGECGPEFDNTVSNVMLFPVKGNKQNTETELLDQAVQCIAGKLPAGWKVSLSGGRKARRRLLKIRAPKKPAVTVRLVVRPGFQPRDIDFIASVAASDGEGSTILVAPFVSPTARRRLKQAGVGYLDATGSMLVSIQTPELAVHLVADGAQRDPNPQPRARQSLKGPVVARVVRALCDLKPPYGVRELASLSGASAPVVSRIASLLEDEGLIDRQARGPIERVDVQELLRLWVQDYGFSTSNQVRSLIEARGLAALLDKLKATKMRYALTGEQAAQAWVQLAPVRNVSVYVDDLVDAQKKLGLRKVDSGANVLLAEPFDPVVFERTGELDGLVRVAPSQAVADLLTGPGRAPAVGQELLTWMGEHEDAWRS